MSCWQTRGCDEEMASRCPHAVSSTDGLCPASCYYAQCGRAEHEHARDLAVMLDPTVDRSAAIKEPCTFCTFFLVNGPRLA